MLKEKFVIIDGNAIVHRAYHAIPPLTNKKGELVNAVYGFASMLLKVWKDLDPKYLAVSFDMAGKTFRHEKFVEYKATRIKADQELYDQIPLCHNLVKAFNIPIFEKSGFEADDVIGTIAKQVESRKPRRKVGVPHLASGSKVESGGIETYIVTGDKDTLQLVDKKIFVYTLGRGMSDIIIYDEKRIRERFGFEPEQMVDFKALAGDSSDNIPGIKGIGEKTATDLIKKIGGIKEIYKNLDKLEDYDFKAGVIKKIKEGKESAEMSYQLATIDCSVSDLDFKLEDCILKEYDKEKVLKFFQEMEFVSLLKRIPGMEENSKVEIRKSKLESSGEKSMGFSFKELKTKKEIEELTKLIEKKKEFACKAITIGADIFESKLKGLIFVVEDKSFYLDKYSDDCLNKIFQNKNLTLIGHNLKQLIKILSVNCHLSVVNCQLFDIMLASYLLNPGSRAHDLSAVIFKILGVELAKDNGQNSLFGADPKQEAKELCYIYQTKEKLVKELEDNENLGLLEKVEGLLIKVLAQMELNGVAIDSKILNKMFLEVSAEIKKLTKKIYDLAGEEFNIASPLQLREILFEKLEIPMQGIKKGKTGISTGASELEKLWGLHPIIEKISEFRELSKLQNTYIDVLPRLVNQKTKRIHTTYNQAITATGRLSSSDPNLQNIPVRTKLGREIKKAFIAESGNILVVADYSQIELRIVASLSKDKNLIEIFKRGEDVHRATASIVNGVSLEKVTPEMRRAAKAVNFGVLYGMGVYGLSQGAKISQWEAKDFIQKYFEKFSEVKKYLENTKKFARESGYVETLFGRKRYLPELNSGNFQVRNSAERMAINHPVQGTAADLMKMAMIKINSQFIANNPYFSKNDVRMILQVHDELVFEVKKGSENQVAKLVKKIMEDVVKLNVPVEVEINIGNSWGEIH